MALNLATLYAPDAVERFKRGSLTTAVSGGKWAFLGDASAKTIELLTNDNVTLNDYERSGVWRYGTPTEFSNTKQSLTIANDKAFTKTIDKRNRTEAAMTIEANSYLAQQIDQVVLPAVDTYRLAQMLAQAPAAHIKTAALSKTNVYEKFLEKQELLGDDGVPMVGRIAYVNYATFNLLKQDTAFVKSGDLSQEMLIKGQLGAVDDVPIVPVPAGLMPTNTAMIVAHKDAIAAPFEILDYNLHMDAPGISGALVEFRCIYDLFVIDTLENGVAVHKTQ